MDISQGFAVDLEKEMRFQTGGVYSKVLAKGEGYHYTLMCLSKGTDIDEHTSTKAGVVQVLKGCGIFRLFNQDIVMVPGVFIWMPADAPHCLRADEDLAILLCLTAGKV